MEFSWNVDLFQNEYLGQIYHSGSWKPNLYGRMIKKILGSEGVHNGIVTDKGGEMYVTEALTKGVKSEPLRLKGIDPHEWYLLLRPTVLNFPHHQKVISNRAILEKGKGYDWKGILSLWIKSRFPGLVIRHWNWKWKFYCTELVTYCYEPLKKDSPFHGIRMPTPLHVEKLIRSGHLQVTRGGGSDHKRAYELIKAG